MTVKIVFVKNENGIRTEIPMEQMTKKEIAEQGRKLKTRFMENFGYEPVKTTA